MEYSVVIPTYNYGKYLSECLFSALNQTLPPTEIIVIDDGSTDNTAEIIIPFLSDHRIIYKKTNNQGVSTARNIGIELSNTDIIAFLDADDVWHLDKMEMQIRLFYNDDVGVVYALRQPFNDNGLIYNYIKVNTYKGNILKYLIKHNFVPMSSAVVRKSCFEQVGMFNSCLTQGEDFDMWLRISAYGYKFDFVDKILVDYRQGGLASSKALIDKRYNDNVSMYNLLFSNSKYSKIIPRSVRMTAWSSLWEKRSYYMYENGNKVNALIYGLKSILYSPFNKKAWSVVIKCLLPNALVSVIRNRNRNLMDIR